MATVLSKWSMAWSKMVGLLPYPRWVAGVPGGRGLAVLAVVAVGFFGATLMSTVASGCSTGGGFDPPPNSNVGGTSPWTIPTSDLASGRCSAEGETRACHKTLGKHGKTVSCMYGEQTCFFGYWSDCKPQSYALRHLGPTQSGLNQADEGAAAAAAAAVGAGHDGSFAPLGLTDGGAWSGKCGDSNSLGPKDPCDPTCQYYSQPVHFTITGMDIVAWANPPYTAVPANKDALVEAGTMWHEPCTMGTDCMFGMYCGNPVTLNQDAGAGACTHDKCAVGPALDPNCGDPCVAAVCAENPNCCTYQGSCAHWPCLPGASLDACMTDPCVNTVCALSGYEHCCDQDAGPTAWDNNCVWAYSGCQAQSGKATCTADPVNRAWDSDKTPGGMGLKACTRLVHDVCAITCPTTTANTCEHDVCVVGAGLTAGCDSAGCVAAVCASNPSCCGLANTWSQACVDAVPAACAVLCPPKTAMGTCTMYLPNENDVKCIGPDLRVRSSCYDVYAAVGTLESMPIVPKSPNGCTADIASPGVLGCNETADAAATSGIICQTSNTVCIPGCSADVGCQNGTICDTDAAACQGYVATNNTKDQPLVVICNEGTQPTPQGATIDINVYPAGTLAALKATNPSGLATPPPNPTRVCQFTTQALPGKCFQVPCPVYPLEEYFVNPPSASQIEECGASDRSWAVYGNNWAASLDLIPMGCTSDADCGGTASCDTTTKICTCTSNAQCPASPDFCYCKGGACSAGNPGVCVHGTARPLYPCTTNADCAVLTPNSSCTYLDADYTCNANCTQDSDCPATAPPSPYSPWTANPPATPPYYCNTATGHCHLRVKCDNASCAPNTGQSYSGPVHMVIQMERSNKLDADTWNAIRTGVKYFLYDFSASSPQLNNNAAVALGTFPDLTTCNTSDPNNCNDTSACIVNMTLDAGPPSPWAPISLYNSSAAFSAPETAWRTSNLATLAAYLDSLTHVVSLSPPYLPALKSALETAGAHVPATLPTRNRQSTSVVMILGSDITDVDSCSSTVTAMRAAAALYNRDYGVRTFVISLAPTSSAVYPRMAAAQQIAAAGRGMAFHVDSTNPIAAISSVQAFLRYAHVYSNNACSYDLPPPALYAISEGHVKMYSGAAPGAYRVNYQWPMPQHTVTAINPGETYLDACLRDCRNAPHSGQAWCFDADPAVSSPTRMVLCNWACEAVTASPTSAFGLYRLTCPKYYEDTTDPRTEPFLGYCPNAGTKPLWSYLAYDTVVGSDNSVSFSLQTANADGGVCPSVSDFSSVPTLTPAAGQLPLNTDSYGGSCTFGALDGGCPIDLVKTFNPDGGWGPMFADCLKLVIKLNPNPQHTNIPTVNSYELRYSCPATE